MGIPWYLSVLQKKYENAKIVKSLCRDYGIYYVVTKCSITCTNLGNATGSQISWKGVEMIYKIKQNIADISAGVVSLLVASFVKGQGWNIQNIMIWLATFVATYITLRLLFMLFKIVRTLLTKKQ